MQYLKRLLFILAIIMGGLVQLVADTQPSSIDMQIQAINQAAPQERVKLMNQFKEQLASMNADERSVAISEMRSQMQGHESKQTQQQMREHAQHDQMQHSEGMQRMDQMQERHAGEQLNREIQGHFNNNQGHTPRQPREQ